MFERFTERARQVIVLAQDESRAMKHSYIGTEHLLLGLLREETGLAATVLEELGVKVDQVRSEIGALVGPGDKATMGQIPFTPRVKKILDLSLREALSLGHNYVGTEHLLLGFVREEEGVGWRILREMRIQPKEIRDAVIVRLSGRRMTEQAPETVRVPEERIARFAERLASSVKKRHSLIEHIADVENWAWKNRQNIPSSANDDRNFLIAYERWTNNKSLLSEEDA